LLRIGLFAVALAEADDPGENGEFRRELLLQQRPTGGQPQKDAGWPSKYTCIYIFIRLILVRRMRALAVLLVTFVATACRVQHPTVADLQVVEFGTFQKTDERGTMAASGSIRGQAHVVADAVLLERTTDIHATRGTSFGLRISFVGEPSGARVPIRAKCVHPKFTDPATGRSSEVEEWPGTGVMGRSGYVGYTFDNDWELVPGQWTIEVSVGSTLRVEKTFNVSVTPND
jgi:hypothetical protein